jgi:hypothetical protein
MKEYFAETAVKVTDSDGNDLVDRDVPSIVTHENRSIVIHGERREIPVTKVEFLEPINVKSGESIEIGPARKA